MEIQQHDGVVVEAAGFQQGFAKRYWRRKRCHERFRNGPEVKIYIWEVLLWSPEKFRTLSVLYRECRKGSGGPPAPGGHMGCRGCALAYMGQGHQPQEAHAPRDKGKEES